MHTVWGLTTVAAATALALGTAGAADAQPARPGDAPRVIGELEASGYDVVVDRVGSGPLEECIVTSVRNPQEVTQTFAVGKGKKREYVTVVVSKSITVSLNCDV
ncbi:hypothetical protein [Mycolicibacterium sp. XJ1819]